MTPMPNAPRTPLKSFRIPEDLYREAQQLTSRCVTVSARTAHTPTRITATAVTAKVGAGPVVARART